jgi:phenylacetate-CoA ligase
MARLHRWLGPRVVLPAYERLSGRRPLTEFRRLDALQWQRPEVIEARAAERLRALLIHAGRRVPLYRALFREGGFDPESVKATADLERLPALRRSALRAGFPREVVAEGVPRARGLLVQTAGSTGEPFSLFRDRADEDAQRGAYLLFQSWAGAELWHTQIRLATRSATDPVNPAGVRPLGLLQRLLLGQRLALVGGPELTAEGLLRCVAREASRGPYHVVALPSYALRLARQLTAAGVTLAAPPRAVVCGGEALPTVHRPLISAAFRSPVVDRYSTVEVTSLAQSCPAHPALFHVNPERAVLRVVRADGTPAMPGERGRVLLTALGNFVMPLVNYDVGDLAVPGPDCPCGRGFATLSAIEGRGIELIESPSGRAISTAALCHFFTVVQPASARVAEFQAEQTSRDEVVLRVVPMPRYDRAFEHELRRTLEAFLGPGLAVRVEVVETIPVEPSGKRLIIRGLSTLRP